MATFAPRPAENSDPWYGARETYDQSLEDAIAANETALGGKLATADAPELIRDTMGAALVAGDNITITPDDAADTITIAAAGGGGLPMYNPPVGNYFDGRFLAGPTGTASRSLTALAMYFMPLLIPVPMTIDRLAVNVATAAAGVTLRVGIFTWNSATNVATLVVDGGSDLDASTTGVKEATINQALAAGEYFVVVHNSGGGVTITGYNPDRPLSLVTAFGTVQSFISKSGVAYGPFAASYTGVGAGNGVVPLIQLRRGA